MPINKPAPLTRAEVQRQVDAAVEAATRPLLEQLNTYRAELAKFAESSPQIAAVLNKTTTADGRPRIPTFTPRSARISAANAQRITELRAEVERWRGLADRANDHDLVIGYRAKQQAAAAELDRLTNNRTR